MLCGAVEIAFVVLILKDSAGMVATDARILRDLLACLVGVGDPVDSVGRDQRGAALRAFDAGRVLELARRHRLSPMLGAIRPPGLPASLAEEFHRDHMVALGRSTLLGHALRDCLTRFAGRGIDAIVLKGLAYEETLYPSPGMRATGDIDLLVEPRFREGTFAALMSAGFAPVAAAPGFDEAEYHEVEWKRGETYVDLHFALAPLQRCGIDHVGVWAEKRPLRLDGAPPAWQLSAPHAAVFHALHMAFHHFDVPSVQLVDMHRLVPDERTRAAAAATARAWRCVRPWRTSLALTASFISGRDVADTAEVGHDAVALRIASAFGGLAPLPRLQQLRRKLEHFDTAGDALRYGLVQGRRKLRELALRRFSARSPEERLGLVTPAGPPDGSSS